MEILYRAAAASQVVLSLRAFLSMAVRLSTCLGNIAGRSGDNGLAHTTEARAAAVQTDKRSSGTTCRGCKSGSTPRERAWPHGETEM